MGYFKLKNKIRLIDLTENDVIPESDCASITPEGTFVQLQYIEQNQKLEPLKIEPGIWAIKKTMSGCELYETSFVEDKILESFVNTKNITDKIDCFFRKIPVYKELGFEVAKRAALLYGPAGTGKSTAIGIIARKYIQDKTTAVLVWHTDKIEAADVKDLIKRFEYTGVDKLILIIEDIGGTEIEQSRMRSDSSLLSLLDNQEKTFTIPTYILATTNYPENFMGNLTNRPNRFDDKIEVGYPPSKARQELLKFFAKEEVESSAIENIGTKKCEEFSPAHIREVVIRSKIYDKNLTTVIEEMTKEIETYKNMFQTKKTLGFD